LSQLKLLKVLCCINKEPWDCKCWPLNIKPDCSLLQAAS
jgi:hypothetical protein